MGKTFAGCLCARCKPDEQPKWNLDTGWSPRRSHEKWNPREEAKLLRLRDRLRTKLPGFHLWVTIGKLMDRSGSACATRYGLMQVATRWRRIERRQRNRREGPLHAPQDHQSLARYMTRGPHMPSLDHLLD